MGCIMKKKYTISRIVICVITFLVIFIGCINEEATFRAVAAIAFTSVSLLAGFIGAPISKKIIKHGNNIPQKGRRILFYILLFPVIILLVCVSWTLIYFLMNNVSSYADQTFAEALGYALMELFILLSSFLFLIIPYIQTLIVLLLGKLIKD